MRSFLELFLLFALVIHAQANTLDPAFEKIPFDQWLAEHDQSRFHWTAGATKSELSFHQRLMTQVQIKLDGRDLESLRGDGKLFFFVQITDGAGARYQSHSDIELSKLDPNIRNAKLEYSRRVFLLPGDFRLAVAILDAGTGEHSARQLQFHVSPPQNDLLTGAWAKLPPVEFVTDGETPDEWYQPAIQGRLQWAAPVQTQARLNVILNLVPSATSPVPSRGQRRSLSGDLAALLPTLKAISETGSSSISGHVEVLDLSRRRIVFKQDQLPDLDWPRLKTSLGEGNTASIDIHSLAERHHDAQFFVSQVRDALRASEKPCSLVILTPPIEFESGEDLQPVSIEGLSACHIVYIRYHAQARLLNPFDQPMAGRRGPRMGAPNRNLLPPETIDQLAATLKPANPKIFDVWAPEQITKALSDIEKALASIAENRK